MNTHLKKAKACDFLFFLYIICAFIRSPKRLRINRSNFGMRQFRRNLLLCMCFPKRLKLFQVCIGLFGLVSLALMYTFVTTYSNLFIQEKTNQISRKQSKFQKEKDVEFKPTTALAKLPEHLYYAKDHEGNVYSYNNSHPLVWIGGVPRSGTTLMRVMLDSHPDIRCGTETRILPRIFQMLEKTYRAEVERKRLEEAGVTRDIVEGAAGAFVMEILTKVGEGAKLLCCKDPFMLSYTKWVLTIFPQSRFILMLRDGRASVQSVIDRMILFYDFIILYLISNYIS